MKLSIALVGLTATQALCNPASNEASRRAALEAECGDLGVMKWNPEDLPAGTDISKLPKCKVHPYSLGINSTSYNPDEKAEDLESSSSAQHPAGQQKRGKGHASPRWSPGCNGGHDGEGGGGGRGNGLDYDYGCSGGWCWRNCGGPFTAWPKPWCWLAYEGGKGGWTPCGGWKDCEWSYNNKNAKCAKGNCKACGCACK
ncbi:victoriocin [Thelonectria olida]|uniref:Victoriocin n=1 Tax=Thelonectria olida TaxID=1576542 RepID=A0A9P8VUF5_9HYPO|nr:victoriocin [Thelonectria olida]